jgi:hypothetical protein
MGKYQPNIYTMATVQEILDRYRTGLEEYGKRKGDLGAALGNTASTEEERIAAMKQYLQDVGLQDTNYRAGIYGDVQEWDAPNQEETYRLNYNQMQDVAKNYIKKYNREITDNRGLGMKESSVPGENERANAMRQQYANYQDLLKKLQREHVVTRTRRAGDASFNPYKGETYQGPYKLDLTKEVEQSPEGKNIEEYENPDLYKQAYQKYFQQYKPQKMAGVMSGQTGTRPTGQRKAYSEYLRGSVY